MRADDAQERAPDAVPDGALDGGASPSHLTEEELRRVRVDLEVQRVRLERSMKVSDEASRPVELDQTAVGRLSRMDSLQNQSMAKSLAERERVEYARVLDALRRIDAGSYGRCTECGAEVPFGRLLVFPEAPTCQACG